MRFNHWPIVGSSSPAKCSHSYVASKGFAARLKGDKEPPGRSASVTSSPRIVESNFNGMLTSQPIQPVEKIWASGASLIAKPKKKHLQSSMCSHLAKVHDCNVIAMKKRWTNIPARNPQLCHFQKLLNRITHEHGQWEERRFSQILELGWSLDLEIACEAMLPTCYHPYCMFM